MKARTMKEIMFRNNALSALLCLLAFGLGVIFGSGHTFRPLLIIPFAAVTAAVCLPGLLFGRNVTAALRQLCRNMQAPPNQESWEYEECVEINRLYEAYRIMRNKLEQQIKKEQQINMDKDAVIRSVQAESAAIKSQVNSGFIDDTLRLIEDLESTGNHAESARITAWLSTVLHSCLNLDTPLISLKEELNQTVSFFRIRQYRGPGQVSLELDVPAAIPDYPVIRLILQPFIEHALVHSFENVGYDGIIRITISETAEELFIRIADNGSGGDPDEWNRLFNCCPDSPSDPPDFYSVQHAYQRLQRSYGHHFKCEYKANSPAGTVVCLRFELPALKIVGSCP